MGCFWCSWLPQWVLSRDGTIEIASFVSFHHCTFNFAFFTLANIRFATLLCVCIYIWIRWAINVTKNNTRVVDCLLSKIKEMISFQSQCNKVLFGILNWKYVVFFLTSNWKYVLSYPFRDKHMRTKLKLD